MSFNVLWKTILVNVLTPEVVKAIINTLLEALLKHPKEGIDNKTTQSVLRKLGASKANALDNNVATDIANSLES